MRKLNIQCLIETVLYILFATALLALIISDRYLSYVTPRMKPYLYFAVVVLFLFGIFSFFRLFQFAYKPKLTHCLVILIPLVIVLIPKNGIDLHSLTSGYINGSDLNGKNNTTSSITATYPFNSSQNKKDNEKQTASSSPDGYLTKKFHFRKKWKYMVIMKATKRFIFQMTNFTPGLESFLQNRNVLRAIQLQ